MILLSLVPWQNDLVRWPQRLAQTLRASFSLVPLPSGVVGHALFEQIKTQPSGRHAARNRTGSTVTTACLGHLYVACVDTVNAQEAVHIPRL